MARLEGSPDVTHQESRTVYVPIAAIKQNSMRLRWMLDVTLTFSLFLKALSQCSLAPSIDSNYQVISSQLCPTQGVLPSILHFPVSYLNYQVLPERIIY